MMSIFYSLFNGVLYVCVFFLVRNHTFGVTVGLLELQIGARRKKCIGVKAIRDVAVLAIDPGAMDLRHAKSGPGPHPVSSRMSLQLSEYALGVHEIGSVRDGMVDCKYVIQALTSESKASGSVSRPSISFSHVEKSPDSPR